MPTPRKSRAAGKGFLKALSEGRRQRATQRTVREWMAQQDCQVLDPDGFRDLAVSDYQDYRCDEGEFQARLMRCTIAPKGWK